MIQKLVAEISFSPAIQEKWPTGTFIAEAHLLGEDVGPWSMRAELWGPLSESGRALAWVSFLSPDAPFTALPLGDSFQLKMGRTVLGSVTLKVYPKVSTAFQENDFVKYPTAPVRRAAA
jgi:hypothetical protein